MSDIDDYRTYAQLEFERLHGRIRELEKENAALKERPVLGYVMGNTMLIVFDANGNQVAKYQGYADECLPRLRADYPRIMIKHGEINT